MLVCFTEDEMERAHEMKEGASSFSTAKAVCLTAAFASIVPRRADHYARSSRREKGIRSQCNTQRPHCRLELTDNAQYPLFSRDKRAECTTLETIEGTSYDHQGGNTRRPVQPFRLRCCQPLCNQVDEPWYPFPWKMVRDKHNPAAPAAYYGSGCDPM